MVHSLVVLVQSSADGGVRSVRLQDELVVVVRPVVPRAVDQVRPQVLERCFVYVSEVELHSLLRELEQRGRLV